MIRRRVLFSGRVQGVGFRATTAALARRLPLAGSVRNLPDGRVELDAQGSERDIQRLLDQIAGAFSGYIADFRQESIAVDERLDRFEIRM